MSNHRRSILAAISFILLLAARPATAQQSEPSTQSDAASAPSQQSQQPDATGGSQTPDQPDQAAPGSAARPAGPACWQQAGIPMKAMRTRAAIMANAKTQIQRVNDDTSLTPQQQKRQIRQIRQNARQQIAKLVTPEQETALQQCQRQRKANAAPPPSAPETTPPASQPN